MYSNLEQLPANETRQTHAKQFLPRQFGIRNTNLYIFYFSSVSQSLSLCRSISEPLFQLLIFQLINCYSVDKSNNEMCLLLLLLYLSRSFALIDSPSKRIVTVLLAATQPFTGLPPLAAKCFLKSASLREIFEIRCKIRSRRVELHLGASVGRREMRECVFYAIFICGLRMSFD